MRPLIALALILAFLFLGWQVQMQPKKPPPPKVVRGKPLMMQASLPPKASVEKEPISSVGSGDQGVMELGFQDLMAFDPDPLEAMAEKALKEAVDQSRMQELIPDSIAALDGQEISVEGFIIPIDFVGDATTEFILVVDPMVCCFGQVPRIHEWIAVKMEDGAVPLEYVDIPTKVRGVLEVGFERDEAGSANLYRMRGLKAEIPEDLR